MKKDILSVALAYLVSRKRITLHGKIKKKKQSDVSRGSENFRKIAAACDVERIKKGRG